jgi:hypothetical protein
VYGKLLNCRDTLPSFVFSSYFFLTTIWPAVPKHLFSVYWMEGSDTMETCLL